MKKPTITARIASDTVPSIGHHGWVRGERTFMKLRAILGTLLAAAVPASGCASLNARLDGNDYQCGYVTWHKVETGCGDDLLTLAGADLPQRDAP